jgi:hypothetical protein
MSDRRSFLTTTALAGVSSLTILGAPSAAVAATTAAAPAVAALAPPTLGVLSEAAIVGVLRKDARYKQLYASVTLKNGAVLHYMTNALAGVQTGYRQPLDAMHATAVLYGPSLLTMMSDAFWDAHVTDELLAFYGEKIPNRKGNPFMRPRPGAEPAKSEDVTSLLAKGATFLVCNNALHHAAEVFAKQPGFPTDRPAYDILRAAIIPEASVVPAGVLAIMTLQEQNYTFFQATIA